MKEIQIPEEKIREMAEKYAIEGAEKAIRDYYTSYNSPYVKRMTEYIESLMPAPHFDLPDLTAAINEAISHRVSEMANEVVARTYLPRLNRLLTGTLTGNVTTQDIYRRFGDFVKEVEGDEFDADGLECRVENRYSGFVYLHLKYQDEEKMRVSLIENGRSEDGHQLYNITGLPGSNIWESRVDHCRYMRIKTEDGTTFETPILDDVLSNDVLSWLASAMINKVRVSISTYHHYEEGEYE